MLNIRKNQEQRIFDAIKALSDDQTAAKIVYGEEGAPKEDHATWVKATMRRLEDSFDRSTVRQIRMSCQCGYGMNEKLALVKELIESSSDLEELASHDKARAAGLSYTGGALHLQFAFCPCPMLAEVDILETDTWCQCTVGYSKFLFEKAFGCSVDVKLLKSIKMGDDICLMTIVPSNTVWA
jgi:hypothetical protein